MYSAQPQGTTIRGSTVRQAVDITAVKPGNAIAVPYELTIGSSMRDFWQSAFYSYDRICTSTPFARSLGLQDQTLPFNLVQFLAASMTHVDQAETMLGFRNAVYHWPAFAGDTFRKNMRILALKPSNDGTSTIVNIESKLMNQFNMNVFTCETRLKFPFAVPARNYGEVPPAQSSEKNQFLDHLIHKVPQLQQQGSQSLSTVRTGQLILHTLSRPLTAPHMMQLATLARITHPRHFNAVANQSATPDLLVPGGLVLALTCSLTARDMHEVRFDKIC